ncbi:MAG: hypothetical protein RBS57_07050 [Desulforhabdus sp.]|jgi:hypothetical protein|nr:hypothetical protein [Desulforhabdus sp.]
MEQRSYSLAQYEIVLIGRGEIWWKAHGGFGDTKSGKCFIEGNVLFIGPSEESEPGSLKNEFLNHLKQLPPWDRTKYYCPSYTLYACKGGRVQDGSTRKRTRAADVHTGRNSTRITFKNKTLASTISPVRKIRQVKGKLGEALRRCERLTGLSFGKNNPEE